MNKRFLLSLGALALTASVVVPSMVFAKTKVKLPKLSNPIAIDSKGDANAIGKYNSEVKNTKRHVVTGTVTAVSATSITVSVKTKLSDSTANANTNTGTTVTTKSYTFTVNSSTKVIRKFKGTATINEVMVGDSVQVWNTALTNGAATLIWDKGIWSAEVTGTVSNLNTSGMAFTLTVTMKGIQYTTTVKMDSATTYVAKDGTVKAISDLVNGQTVKVRGSWNSVGNYMLAKRMVILK